MLELNPPPTLRDVADRAGVSVSTVNRVLADSPLAGAASRQKVEAAIAELGYRPPTARRSALTIADVAKHAGVSASTVSRAMSDTGQVSDSTRARVLAAMRELDFVANGHARALNRSGHGQVALISASMLGPAFVGIAQAIESVVSPLGHQLVVHTTGDDPEREAAHVATLREQRARAVVFIGGVEDDAAYRARIARYARSLASVECRLVLCARPQVPGVDAPSVNYDNTGAVRTLTEHLIELGHTRIAFIGGRDGQSTVLARRRGYETAMDEADLHPVVVHTGDWETEDGVAAATHLWAAPRPPTALVGVRDQVAVGALRELRSRGVCVPEEVSVTGFDDLPLAGDLTPALTTVRNPMRQVGEAVAWYALSAQTDGPDTMVLPAEVLYRESTAPVR